MMYLTIFLVWLLASLPFFYVVGRIINFGTRDDDKR
jgi:hypothetical protein